MIGFMPEIYPNELVYSWLARYHVRSGGLNNLWSRKELLKNPRRRLEIEFLNKYTDELYPILTNKVPIEDIIINHTMFAAYAMFLLPNKRKDVFNSFIKADGKHRSIKGMNIGETNRYMKYCPICAFEDRKKYGETYWHVDWEIEGINICTTHKCYLNKTNIVFTGSKRKAFLFITAEEIIPEQDTAIECNNLLELKLSKYLIDILHTKIDIENMTPLGEFLHSKLIGTKYITSRGQVRKLQLLCDDLKTFYEDTNFKHPNRTNTQEIFLNQNYTLMHICMLTMFLNVKPEEVVNRKLPSKNYTELFDEKVRKLHKNGMTFEQIAEKLKISKSAARSCYHNNYKAHNVKELKKNKIKYTSEIDKETLQKVKIEIEKIYNGDYPNMKPRRVTEYGIGKRIGFPQKAFNYLPLCMSEIKKYEESYPEYWAREVVWAVEHINKEHITLTDIILKTNIRDYQFVRCLPYLCKYTNEETADMIRQLVKS